VQPVRIPYSQKICAPTPPHPLLALLFFSNSCNPRPRSFFFTHETAAVPSPPSQHRFLGFLSRKKHGRKKRKKKTEKTTDPELQTIKSCKIKAELSSFSPSIFYKRKKLIACEADEPDFLDCGYK
jgi:hypothetical protein